MKKNVLKVLLPALLAGGFVSQAEANPWWWPVKTADKAAEKTTEKASDKPVQYALPVNNGAVLSITLPSKTKMKPASLRTAHRRAEDTVADRREDERIAADLERHF